MAEYRNKYGIYLIKQLIFLIIALSANTCINAGDLMWLRQVSNTTKAISRICFIDSLNGWAVGDSGLIIHTSTGGNLWEDQISQTDFFINDVRFINSSTGWAIANNYFGWPNCTILKTTNSGINWIKYPFADTTLLLFTVCFKNEFEGWASGYQGIVLKTGDGGVSWSVQPRDTSEFSYNTVFRIKIHNQQAIACGGIQDFAGVVWKNPDLGSSWLSRGIGSEPLYDITFLDSGRILCVGGDPEYGVTLFSSTNSGNTWRQDTLSIFGIGKAISFRTPVEGWIAASFSSKFIITTDAAVTWREIPAPDNSTLNEVLFVNVRNGWAAGINGAIFKYNSSLIGIENNNNKIPEGFILYQNYPNPFNPVTLIKFYIAKQSDVKLTVFDLTGREVKNIINKNMSGGEKSVTFDSSDLPSGVYLYRLEVKSSSGTDEFLEQTKKMVVLK